jgi:chromate transporter
MVAYIRNLAVEKKRWLSKDSFDDGVALCQTVPGATAMQSAAYVGLRARGFSGAAAAYIGFGLPAFLFVLGLAVLYQLGHNAPLVITLLSGLRALVIALIANAALSFGRTTLKNWCGLPVVGGAAVALYFRVSPIYVILGAALLGLVLPLRRALPEARITSDERRTYLRPLLILLGVAAGELGILAAFDYPLFQLALTMLRIDLFAFGGGFASIPLMQHEFVDVHHWVTAKVFIDGIAVGQVTPGPIVLTATFVGYVYLGLVGALVGTIAIFLPSFAVLALVEPYFERIKRNSHFNRAIGGILLSFVGLLLAVAIRLGLNVSWEIWSILLAVAAFAALRLKVDVMWVVLGGIGISLLVGLA